MEKVKQKKLESIVNYKKVFKEADNEDKVISAVRKLTGMYLQKNGLTGLQKELGIEAILFLMNEIRVEGKAFDTSKSDKLRKSISLILKHIEENPDVM